MKNVASILCVSALTTAAFAQGLVNFGNGPTTQITAGGPGVPVWGDALPANSAGSFYFGLLTSPMASGPFTFAGVYGTNSAAAGRIGTYTTSVPGWAPGTSRFYEVAGWSANLGQAFNPNWLVGNFDAGSGFFGLSAVANGTPGGGGALPAPSWNLFGGTGLTGFNLLPVNLVPEPSTFTLAGVGAALFVFRRWKLIH